MQSSVQTENTESAIWVRVIQTNTDGLSPDAARSILKLGFSEQDKARMHDLAQRNNEGLLSERERRELEDYVRVGDVLSLLHLKARKALKA
jgi:hypothetical protein